MQSKFADLSTVKINPKNPRSITEEKFKKLVNSLLALPKMLEIRPIAVDRDNTVLGGNMRLRALQTIAAMPFDDIKKRLDTSRDVRKKTPKERQALETYWRDWLVNPLVPIVDVSTLTKAEQKEFVIKDNGDFGQWDYDMLANEWDADMLDDWGVDLPIAYADVDIDDFFDEPKNQEENKLEKIIVELPDQYSSIVEEIKNLLSNTLSDSFPGCKIK